jgi:KUP system potassium uptake protein
MEPPDVPTALALTDIPGFRFDPDDTTYLLGRELVTATRTPGMHPLRERLFAAMNRSSAGAARFFGLPTERVFEVGTQVDI